MDSKHRIRFSEAAPRIGLTESRLRQLARAGELRTAQKQWTPTGGYWTIARKEVDRLAARKSR